MKKWTIQGVTDEVTSCDCCGRQDLKRTVALLGEDGDEVFFGTECAAKALELPAADVRKQSRKAQDARQRKAEAARRKAADEEFAEWCSFLRVASGMSNAPVCLMIEKLGGHKAAREQFQRLNEISGDKSRTEN